MTITYIELERFLVLPHELWQKFLFFLEFMFTVKYSGWLFSREKIYNDKS